MAVANEAVWEARWRGVRPNAAYRHTWGLEGAWRANADEWGFPLTDDQHEYDAAGGTYPGRVFSGIGLVVWKPDGAQVVGWP
ncbi:MAG: hypothetical protein GEU71_03715 [Actinobacteria bacterium]|nr:hypothetical protein [Actinomycetota bacterium]